MSPAAAQFQFGAEFLGFLAAIAGVALALLRAAPRRPPPGVAVAFGALAAVAFVAGSRLVEDRGDAWVALPRLLAAGLLAGTVVLWEVEARTKALLLAGAFVTALAVPLVAVYLTVAADAAVAAGGLLIGGAVLDLGRSSVASRFAVSGGASLLVIVLVLSVAMSAVVDSNLRGEAVKRLDDRAAAEAGAPRKNLGVLVRVAALARDRLVAAETANPDQPAERVRAIEAALAELSRLSFDNEAYLYIGADNAPASPLSPSATVLGEVAKRNLGPARVVALAGDPVVQDARCPATSAPGVTVVLLDDKAYGVVANPLCAGVSTLLGRLVVLSPLDNGRLTEAIGVDGGPMSLALHAASRVVAQSGDQPEPAAIRVLAGAVLSDGKKRSALVGERFVSAAPVVVLPNRPATLVLVASSPTATISETRDGLFRALFAIALLGTLVALLLAALVGERIGARLRNLTHAAEALRRDSPGVRTGLTGDDELGTLGRTFDNMASAIEEKTKDQKRLSGRLEAVVNEMGEALVATDAQARITEFNRSAVHLIGMSTEAALGAQVDQVVSLSEADDGLDLPTRLKAPPATSGQPGPPSTLFTGRPFPWPSRGRR